MGYLRQLLVPETREHPGNAAALLGVWDAGWGTATGRTVTPETALTYSAVWAAVRVLSESVAQLPLILYERLEPRGKRRARGHGLFDLLHDAPNSEMTAYEFREALMGHLCTWGNAYAEIEVDRRGEVIGLWPLRPDRMAVKRLWNPRRLVYEYELSGSGKKVLLAAEQVLHLRGLGFDGVIGYSPVNMARQGIGLGLAAEEYGARFFGNGARPGVVLEHPGELSEKAFSRLKESWLNQHEGLEKAHRVAILEEGIQVKEIGMPPEDAQFLQTRRFQVEEVARMYRVPPHMLADLEHGTFSNIEHLGLEFVAHSLGPWLVRWEQRITQDLLTPAERGRYFAEHLVAGLLRGDLKTRYEAYAVGRNWGWLSADDVREMENMNPLPDGAGEVYLQPLNMVEAGEEVSGQLAEASGQRAERQMRGRDEDDGREATGLRPEAMRAANSRRRLALSYRRTLADVAQRIMNREANDVAQAARKYLRQRGLFDFKEWLRKFYEEHVAFIMQYLMPVMLTYAELIVKEIAQETGQAIEGEALQAFMDEYVASRSRIWAARHQAAIMATLDRAVAEGEASEADMLALVEALVEELKIEAAGGFADDESIRIGGSVARWAFAAAGVAKLRWVAFGENCDMCSHLNGAIVEVSGWFVPVGESLPNSQGEPFRSRSNIGHPPLHNGCDCMIVAA